MFGRELVGELNRLGILIDISHTGIRSSSRRSSSRASRSPFTHESLHTRNPVPRNTTDEEIKALAAPAA